MIFALLLLQATAPLAPGPADTRERRFERCVAAATAPGPGGAAAASAWKLAGGGVLADQCLGMAYATQGNYAAAAAAFEAAARGAEITREVGTADRTADHWAQAGNAWLAAGDAVRARAALDAALATGKLTGLALGEAQLDRARARVAANDLPGARLDIDRALTNAPADPLAWLLSATLARRAGDAPRAQKDIAEALTRAPDDAAVQLEAGNIAAQAGDELGARGGWTKAAKLGAGTPVERTAKAALAQFEAER
ncbi:tetratricopeptide repeat protein [Sphingomonas sp. RS2018]